MYSLTSCKLLIILGQENFINLSRFYDVCITLYYVGTVKNILVYRSYYFIGLYGMCIVYMACIIFVCSVIVLFGVLNCCFFLLNNCRCWEVLPGLWSRWVNFLNYLSLLFCLSLAMCFYGFVKFWLLNCSDRLRLASIKCVLYCFLINLWCLWFVCVVSNALNCANCRAVYKCDVD